MPLKIKKKNRWHLQAEAKICVPLNMCYLVFKQLLIVVFIFTVKGTSLTKFVNLISITCDMECKFPQARSVVVAHEIEIQEDTLPHMTVLHR